MKSPKLWIVATPIGNLGDVSKRAIEVLSKVDVILAEDTRKAGVFCSLIGVRDKSFLSLFDRNEESRVSKVLQLLREGKEVAIISNAGMPLISDPGYKIVRACRKEGFEVSVVPGPTAPVAALVLSGFPPVPFVFVGFLPRNEGAKKDLFFRLKELPFTFIFFERKSRIRKSLEVLFELMGKREVCVVREITKVHEEVIFLNSKDDLDLVKDLKGEITVVVAPFKGERTPEDEVINMATGLFKEKFGIKETVKELMKLTTGWNHKELYNICLKVRKRFG